MITTLKKLMTKMQEWLQDSIPDSRTTSNDAGGRLWFLKSVGYSDSLTLEDLRNFVDSDDQNSQFVSRRKEKNAKARKGISALKVEISALYSFKKCFVQRHKGRIHFYRDDLSQKAARNMRTASQATADFLEFKSKLDK